MFRRLQLGRYLLELNTAFPQPLLARCHCWRKGRVDLQKKCGSVAEVSTHQPSRKFEAGAFEGLALRLSLPLLALALTHCGGKERSGQPSSGGASVSGDSSAGSSTESESRAGSAAGGAGLPSRPMDDGTLIDVGGAPASTPTCNALQTNERASTTVIAEAPPKPEGGTLLNGLYHLTKREDFVGPTGDTNRSLRRAQATLAISASTGVSADVQLYWFEPFGELPLPVGQNETVVVTGTSYAYTVTCATPRGSTAPGEVPFTATADELLWIYPTNDGATRVETFQRE